jgi:hypothetical protein
VKNGLEEFDLDTDKNRPWTPERMENAVPEPVPIAPPDYESNLEIDVDADITESTFFQPQYPEPTLNTIAQPVPRDQRFKPPFASVGKLFFRRGGKDRVGSAFLVGKLSLLMTAGHCCSQGGFRGNPGERATDFSWEPFYPYPLNVRPTKNLIPNRWLNHGLFDSDYAFLLTKYPVLHGMPALGAAFNLGFKGLAWESIGFPVEPPFDGSWQNHTSGNAQIAPYRGNPMGMKNNDMTGGCSGGPWMAKNHNLTVNGINSHSVSEWKNIMYSPYFGSTLHSEFVTALNTSG